MFNRRLKSASREQYLSVVRVALEKGIVPRCHFEDLTRADTYGFCVPFAIELMKLKEESGIDIKIRLCDTPGYGVTYPGPALPWSVPKLVLAMIDDAGVAYWVNHRLGLKDDVAIDKRHPGIIRIHKRISREYEAGRATSISQDEMERWARQHLSEYFISEFDLLKKKAYTVAADLDLAKLDEETGKPH